MSGNWIKTRVELHTHPRFIALCNHLAFSDENYGLLIYTCGEDALGIGALPPSDLSVVTRALRCVTERALRDVTLAALLRVWCAVNAHCKVREMDAVMSPMGVQDVDAIAGFDGFGDAMVMVEWLRDSEGNSLVFPNFLEYNEPACLRRKTLSRAEIQKRHRERIKDSKTALPRVTARYLREEKRREESRGMNSPTTPSCPEPEIPARGPADATTSTPEQSSQPEPHQEIAKEAAPASAEPKAAADSNSPVRAAPANAQTPAIAHSNGNAILSFPTVGAVRMFYLTDSKLREYQESYQDLDVLAECRAARQWCIDNPSKRKTASGMPRFLAAWLVKAQNSGRAGKSTQGGKRRGTESQEYDPSRTDYETGW